MTDLACGHGRQFAVEGLCVVCAFIALHDQAALAYEKKLDVLKTEILRLQQTDSKRQDDCYLSGTLDERERCARIAEANDRGISGFAGAKIAAKIREGKT